MIRNAQNEFTNNNNKPEQLLPVKVAMTKKVNSVYKTAEQTINATNIHPNESEERQNETSVPNWM